VARDAPKEAWEARRVRGVGTPGRRTSIAAVWRMDWAGMTNRSVDDRTRRRRTIIFGAW